MSIKSFLSGILVASLLMMMCTDTVTSSLNCSQYSSDIEILNSLPFPFELTDISQCGSVANCFALNSKNQTIAVNVGNVPETLQVFCFKHVTTFYIWGRTPPWRIAPEIANMVDLTDMIFWGLAGNKIPEEIGKLKQLQKLRIGGEKLIELPPIIGSLTSVTYLFIWAPLRHLPSFLGNLPLSELRISRSTNFTDIPKKLFKNLNPTLRSLNLGDIGNLKSLDSFTELTKLTSLTIDFGNGFAEFPWQFTYLTSLQSLDWPNNQFTSLPKNISKNLVYAKLNSDGFTQIPQPLLLSKKLEGLDLSWNQIDTLKNIGLLNSSSISSLNLYRNRIRSLPREIIYLSDTLENLYLDYNQLITVPAEELVKMKKLTHLYLMDNPISSLEKKRLKKIFDKNPNMTVIF